MKPLVVASTRPELVKLAPLLKEFEERGIESVFATTGQHYDSGLYEAFLEDLELRPPDRDIKVGSGGHGDQTARALQGLERLFSEERPDVVVVEGDTNSVLSASLAAAKLRIPLAHVEAGLRSHDRRMPEEINRITLLEKAKGVNVESNILEIRKLNASTAALRAAMSSFEKYLPKELIKSLLSQKKEIELSGEKKEITIFFTDIAGFTALVKELSAEELLPLLSEYFDTVSKIILDEHGTIDKFIGDSIMAFWGAPIITTDHADKAAREYSLSGHK